MHINENLQTIETQNSHFTLPIIFCIDVRRLLTKETYQHNNNTNKNENEFVEQASFNNEFNIRDEENDIESNNSFIYTLCQRLSEQLSYKHIQYGNANHTLTNFYQLKMSIIESMGTCAGYVIEHFPTSLDDLEKFQTEVMILFLCARLIILLTRTCLFLF